MPTNRKSERGFASLIVLLISLALIMALMALVSINLVQIGQAKNEQNANQGVTALMSAEAGYIAAFPSSGYATGTNLHYLSDCPAPVTQNGKTTVTPTPTAACQNVSATYTNTKAAYSYAFNVVPTVGPDGVAGTSDDGFLITATPSNKALGRLTYCANNQDGVLRGQIEGVTPTTAAACDAFGVIAAGVASAAPAASGPPTSYTTWTDALTVSSGAGGTTLSSKPITLTQAGTYLISATSTVATSATVESITCYVADDLGNPNLAWLPPTGANGFPTATIAASQFSGQTGTPVAINALVTASGIDHVALVCTTVPSFSSPNWRADGNFGMTGVGLRWKMGPTFVSAVLVNNTAQ